MKKRLNLKLHSMVMHSVTDMVPNTDLHNYNDFRLVMS